MFYLQGGKDPTPCLVSRVKQVYPRARRKMGDFAGDVANFGLYRLLSLCIHEVAVGDLALGELARAKRVSGGFSSTCSGRSSRPVPFRCHS